MYGPDVAILLMYGSHDIRHTGFLQVDSGQRDPRDLGRHTRAEDRERLAVNPLESIFLEGLDKSTYVSSFYPVGRRNKYSRFCSIIWMYSPGLTQTWLA